MTMPPWPPSKGRHTSRRNAGRTSGHASPGARDTSLYYPMNKTEHKYADFLTVRLMLGEIVGWEFEPEVLVLSDGKYCTYKPDFKVTLPDGSIEYHEVKGGYIREDSRIKLKWAATKYHPTPFYLCQYRGPKRGWKIKRV